MATMNMTADELRAELAKLEVAESKFEAIEGTIHGGHGGLHLTIRDVDFECRRVSVSWQMMQFAKAQRMASVTIPSGLPKDSPEREKLEAKRSEAGMKMMSLLLDTIMILLKPHERDRFESYMDEISADGLEQGELEQAIGAVIAAAGGEQGKAEQTTASPSSASSQTTSENVKVVSFKQDGGKAKTVAKTS